MAKTPRYLSENDILVWFVEILEVGGYVQWHLRLSQEVADGLRIKLEVLLARQKICGFQIQRVDETVVPAFRFYKRYGMDR